MGYSLKQLRLFKMIVEETRPREVAVTGRKPTLEELDDEWPPFRDRTAFRWYSADELGMALVRRRR